jgi:hypothetical protein
LCNVFPLTLFGQNRHLAGKYFDQSSGHVAGAMFLLSYFFTGSGDLPKAIYYNEIAVNMLEQLLIAQKALNETPDPNLLHVFANCLFAQVDSAPSLFVPPDSRWRRMAPSLKWICN